MTDWYAALIKEPTKTNLGGADWYTKMTGPEIVIEDSIGQNTAKKIPATLDEKVVLGIPETAAQIATSSIAEPLAGVAGLIASLTPGTVEGSGAAVVEGVKNRLTYKPRSEGGKDMLPDVIHSILDATPDFIKKTGSDITGGWSELEELVNRSFGPAAASALSTLPTAILEAIPAGLAIRKLRAVGKTVDPAATVNKVPLDQKTINGAQSQEAMAGDLRSGKTVKVADQVNPDQQILDDAAAVGISLNPSHYSTNRAYIEMEQALKSRPGSTLGTVESKAIVDLGEKADDLIEELGGSTDKSLLDANIRSDFEGTTKALNEKSDALYKKVDEGIPRGTRATPLKSLEFIEQQLEDLGGDMDMLTSAERSVHKLAASEGVPTYAAIDRVRRDIGNAIGKRSGPFKDDDTGQLKQLYAALSEDQQNVADAFGLGNEYRDASSLVKQRKRLEDKAVDLFGKEVSGSLIPKMKSASNALAQGDVSKLGQLMEAIPEGRRAETAATLLNNIFTSGARRNGPLGQGFVSAFEGLNRNKGAKAELFKYLPEGAEERFNQLGRIATGLYKAKALENTSQSARAILASMDNGNMFSKIYGIGKKVAVAEGVSTSVGIPGAGAAAVIGSVLSKGKTPATQAADELLASPEFKAAIEKAAAGKASAIEKNQAYQKWLKTQKPNIRKEIAAIGFVPWLTAETPEETASQQ